MKENGTCCVSEIILGEIVAKSPSDVWHDVAHDSLTGPAVAVWLRWFRPELPPPAVLFNSSNHSNDHSDSNSSNSSSSSSSSSSGGGGSSSSSSSSKMFWHVRRVTGRCACWYWVPGIESGRRVYYNPPEAQKEKAMFDVCDLLMFMVGQPYASTEASPQGTRAVL